MSATESIWYPTRLMLNKESSFVRWTDLAGMPFVDPFFHHTVSRAHARSTIHTTLEGVPPDHGLPVIEPSAFIFHVSRCGSTLLCNLLRALNNVHVVAEAQPITALLTPFSERVWPYSSQEFEQKRSQLLRQTVHRLGRSPTHVPCRYMIKFTSYSAMSMGVLRAMWPDVPILFLVREPTEVMISNLSREPGWMRMRQSSLQAKSVFGWAENSAEMTRETFCARVFERICGAATVHKGSNSMVMDYRELASGNFQRVISFLGLGNPDTGEQVRIEMAMQMYSKSLTERVRFEADSKTKLSALTPEISEAASYWASPALKNLVSSLNLNN